ncbi:Mu transposase C-terminal domain-containing protein [Francisella philomiragia]|uniref:Integrase core domain protein n=1 Tax=Francisella philomiragia TaxID=28110 RepID=A0A0B6CSL6_9GAMM|nr:DDE-type integrase/transposase/recombinase [Francisella philomiragia]AJI53444.1 integrase core domain protein [Francisella philomiragia]
MSQYTIDRSKVVIKPKQYVKVKNDIFRITQTIDFETVVGVNIKTGKAKSILVHEIKNIIDKNEIISNEQDVSSYTDTQWQEIERRFEIIKPLLGVSTTKEDIETVAENNNIHFTTIYRWLRNYRISGAITSLLKQKPGSEVGSSRISQIADMLIEKTIEEYYLTKQKPCIQRIIELVHIECHNKNITPPSKNTIRSRIAKISNEERLKKQGNKDIARNIYSPAAGSFPHATNPLSVVQIDHTLMDIILVDDENRLPIGRPWITLAIDVYSRMITGYYLSLEPPSEASVALCLTCSMLPKDKLLLQYEVDADWPVWGIMNTIHVDNGADFRSDSLRKSCLSYGINIEFRPVGKPNFGGHIERLIGTIVKKVHSLPGTTFSNISERGNYDSDKNACLTFKEFEKWLLLFITKVYHQKKHSSLGMSPLQKWEDGIFGTSEHTGCGYPTKPNNQDTLLIDFLPIFNRTIQRAGVNIDGLNYYDNCLRPWINHISSSSKQKEKFIFRRDPRDISYIWFFEPQLKQYFKITLADQSIPPISLFEYKSVKSTLKTQRAKITSSNVLLALEEMQHHVKASASVSRKIRRQKQRKDNIKEQLTIKKTPITNSTNHEDDLWDDDVEAFD